MEKRILMVDDEKDFTDLVATLLRFHDFQVDVINDSTAVSKAISTHLYDLILTDLMMPDLNGFELVQIVRNQPQLKEKPILVLSAKVLTDEERKTLLKHQAHVLPKPFEPHDLVEHIRSILAP